MEKENVTYQDFENARMALCLEYVDLIRKRVKMLAEMDAQTLNCAGYNTDLSDDIRAVNAIESAMVKRDISK